MPGSASLPSLLWIALDGFDRAHADQGAGTRGMPSLEQWANLLRVLEGQGIDRRELPALLRLSRRAVRSGVAAAVRQGWATECTSGPGRGAVQLTADGSDIAARWEFLRQPGDTVSRLPLSALERHGFLRRVPSETGPVPVSDKQWAVATGILNMDAMGGPSTWRMTIGPNGP